MFIDDERFIVALISSIVQKVLSMVNNQSEGFICYEVVSPILTKQERLRERMRRIVISLNTKCKLEFEFVTWRIWRRQRCTCE